MGFLDKLFGSLFGKKKEKQLDNNIEPVKPKPKTEKQSDVQPTVESETTQQPTPVALISPEPEVDNAPQELSFDISVPSTRPDEELEFYANYLSQVNQEFGLLTEFDVSFSYDKGLNIYNHETEDLVVSVNSAESNFIMRTNNHITNKHRNIDEIYIRNLGVLNQLFSRYLINNGRKEKVFAHLIEPEDGPKIIRTYLTTKTSGLEGKQLQHGEFFDMIIDNKSVEDILEKYEKMGVFDNLDEATITRGRELSTQYNLVNAQDVLWYFRYLIADCCPRESSGNQRELEKFVKITNNKLTLSDFEETNVDGKLNVTCKINGETFTSNSLPEFFSLRLIYDLNQFLLENFGSCFYIFQWERNPWEQQTFIYFTKEQLEKIGMSRDFGELVGEIVDFYENS